jgi:hypothetical protein
MKEINLKPYQGKCNMIYELRQLVRLSFSSLFKAVIVHGSIANEDEIAYSDFDGLLILKGGATESPLFHEFIKVSQKIILKFDPLQHHGWFMIKESELNSYPEHYLPSLVLESSRLIWPKKPMRLTVQSSEESDFIKPFSHLSSHVLGKVKRGWRPTNMYQLKSFLSEVMLLPCLFMTAMDQKPVLKELSFEAAEKRFPHLNWSSVQAASLIRSSWAYHLNPIQKLVMRQPGRFWRKVTEKKIAPAIPKAMGQVLDEAFYTQLSELIHHMKNEVK